MSGDVLFLNGQYLPTAEARISVFDRVVSAGDGIYDVARTFRHVANKLSAHCERLCRSAKFVRITLGHSAAELAEIGQEVLRRNLTSIDPGDDRILWYIATRGIDPPTRNPLDASTATLMVYTMPPNYHRFARFYREGARLITASTRRTPSECIDSRAKITNKMNHILAEFEAKASDRDAIPVMLGTDGRVAEASFANIFFVSEGRLCTPRSGNILLGIMRENVLEMAAKLGLDVVESDFYSYDLQTADEIFLSTTSFSILPVSRMDGRELPAGPGPLTARLMKAWSEEIGMDFVAQAERFSNA